MIDDHDALRALVYHDRQTEKECQPFLRSIAYLLCAETPSEVIACDREERSSMGASDFSVSARFTISADVQIARAYVWEVKAPQTYLFEFDDNPSRLRPTKELIKAETQLVHYVPELGTSRAFRDKYGLDASSEVLPAGIIMGRNDRLVRPGKYRLDADQIRKVFRTSYYVRDAYLYRRAGIRLLTWDWVLEKLRREELEMERINRLAVHRDT